MANDPYGLCPCGSGKKLKWCCGALIEELEKAASLIHGNQPESALKILDKLLQKGANPAYVRTLRAQAAGAVQGMDEAFKEIESTIADFPEFALAREVRGDLLYVTADMTEALDAYRDAQSHYPPEATDHHARALFKIGNCHNLQGRPLAAWAAWQRAMKLVPNYGPAASAIDNFITQNEVLPSKVRRGLYLKSPDEFALFNEDRRVQWDKALSGERDWHLEDVIAAFEVLVENDKHDAAAWYNLAIACAWAGENARAIEALDEYVQLETDFEAAAEAWDLCEILRVGFGAEEYSDILLHVAVYEIVDVQEFTNITRTCGQIIAMGPTPQESTIFWADRPFNRHEDASLIQVQPKLVAEVHVQGPVLELVATSEENLRQATSSFESVLQNAVRRTGGYQQPGTLDRMDREAIDTLTTRRASPEALAQSAPEHVGRYFEEEWLHRPLKSLGNLAPIDAAQSDRMKSKLEGVVRFRERNFARYGIPYNFDRLRNKLGLEPHEVLPPDAMVVNDVTGYSVAQLAELQPAELDDDDLVKAYQTACRLDAPATSLNFAVEIVRRDSIADKIDAISVFRRIIQDKLERSQVQKAFELVDEAEAYDQRHYERRNAASIGALRARCLIGAGESDKAVELLRNLVDQNPDNLQLVAQAIENMFSLGQYDSAQQLAKLGLERAEALRNGDFQGQFREYLEEASARV